MAPQEGGLDMRSEERRAAFVSGASYGIGAAVAVALARDGFDVAVTDLTTDALGATVSNIEAAGGRAVPVTLDVRSQSSITRSIAEAARALGGLDVLVNNAGVPLIKPALDITPQEWDAVISVNLTGTFFISQEMGRYLIGNRRPGSIISIASTHGVIGAAGQSAYGISKAAVIHMTRMLAIEWAEYGVCVNAVAPGKVDTPSPVRQAAVADPANRERMLARIPLRRFARSEEVAAMVCYLAGPQATYITGQTLLLDGGLTAY
jgi:NAD(P)-dependent dehydrogenase (short-subunit alcohol dehydrogenase family)